MSAVVQALYKTAVVMRELQPLFMVISSACYQKIKIMDTSIRNEIHSQAVWVHPEKKKDDIRNQLG